MGLFDCRKIETTPGRNHNDPFNPPAGFEGDENAYRELMLQRWKDVATSQRMRLAVRFLAKESWSSISVQGPYAGMAVGILNHLLRLKLQSEQKAAETAV